MLIALHRPAEVDAWLEPRVEFAPDKVLACNFALDSAANGEEISDAWCTVYSLASILVLHGHTRG